jgi:hypothetical protein
MVYFYMVIRDLLLDFISNGRPAFWIVVLFCRLVTIDECAGCRILAFLCDFLVEQPP